MSTAKRLFICGIATESHGFNKKPTILEDFTERGLFFTHEHEDLSRFREGDNYIGGYLDVAEREGWELVTGVAGFAYPAGPVDEATFEHLRGRIEKQLRAEGPFDGILMPMHGGMACEHLDDPEGDLVARIREIVGSQVPIGVTLDLHSNLSPQFVRDCDIICGFHTAPHIDVRNTSFRVASLMARTLRGEIKPECHSIHPPLVTGIDHGRSTVPHAPLFAMLDRAKEIQADDPQLLDASFMASFPFADQPWTGPSAVLVMDGPSDKVNDYLDEFGAEIWRTRDVLTITIVSIDEALDVVDRTSNEPKPFLLGDFSDCPYAGAYGDTTAFLAAMIERQVPNAVFAPVFDIETVEQVHAAGVGAEIDVALGGKSDPSMGGGPLEARAKVLALSDGKFMHKGPFHQGQPGTLGKSAMLDIGGINVIVCSLPTQIHDREQLRLFGLEPESMNLIVSKAFNHMRADLEPISRGLLYPDAGGIFSFDFAQFPWEKIRRPIWPLDDFEISPADMARS
ncbi:MAG: M81 family metallopeptidase [Alphaproteobacteria bacterium]|jgi:microcystin degradation protein MlrC|nr:M81 family metallopeptidase [Alphaproteobacteria bacterium]MDP7165173.1 M81 family metallopeptidase [Alphaproteobacteria bacterium]